MSNWNLGIIGAGNMASTIVKGVLRKNLIQPSEIYIYDIDQTKQSKLISETSIIGARSNIDLIEQCSIIIIAVKPDVYGSLLDEMAENFNHDQIIVSIAAGISTQYIKEKTNFKPKVVRVMPNTPALVGEGMSVICKKNGLNEDEKEIIKSIFLSLGQIEEVDEKLMNGVTAISGSSPAYVYLFIEALADGGVLMGLPRDQAYRLAAQTVIGAGKMVLELDKHPGLLKDMVCSPGGTSIEGVYTLEKNGFRGAIMEAVQSSALKSQDMDDSSRG